MATPLLGFLPEYSYAPYPQDGPNSACNFLRFVIPAGPSRGVLLSAHFSTWLNLIRCSTGRVLDGDRELR
jgi:hypothetical protein